MPVNQIDNSNRHVLTLIKAGKLGGGGGGWGLCYWKVTIQHGCRHGILSIVSGGMTQCCISPLTNENSLCLHLGNPEC